MNITIRTAVPEDCEKIKPLQKEIADLHYNGRPDLFKTEPRCFTSDAFTERLNTPGHYVYIAENNAGEVVGYAFANINRIRNHSTYIDFDQFYIDDICVLQKYQRMGIGRALFETCKDQGKQLGCYNIDLGVWCFNKEAIAFYESCGMSPRIMKMELILEDHL
ncbi:MAG TPA: GNAT family N-acetyltransferase [Oscillospiraceae bacterium]|nr:GNAT family N-acetyltransferase [Oscillospiraceae bacterium]HPF55741.1 GNAT family N-acetyltransferase [Clostridiales bacterium]HPK34262.1 GNAT family N-acetyltransferase [Oscillospiraceae bacterium]HPR74835.1 GNAT family N-acetyltransferase [Oscillospiraceae bacterium]